jgi:hypothetical protein
MIGLILGSLFVAFVTDPTVDRLPASPWLRLALVSLATVCFLLAASLVRHLRDVVARAAVSVALVAAGTWFAIDVAGLGGLGGATDARAVAETLGATSLLVAGLAVLVAARRLAAARVASRRPL